MLYWLGQQLTNFYGPFRLLTSYLFLAGSGAAVATVATWYLLPRLWHYLPADKGRAHAVGAQHSPPAARLVEHAGPGALYVAPGGGDAASVGVTAQGEIALCV